MADRIRCAWEWAILPLRWIPRRCFDWGAAVQCWSSAWRSLTGARQRADLNSLTIEAIRVFRELREAPMDSYLCELALRLGGPLSRLEKSNPSRIRKAREFLSKEEARDD
jgi:hypothetical protein